MVTPSWLDAEPIFTRTGVASPATTFFDVRALICRSQGIPPGASPAYSIVAAKPPISTVIGATGLGTTSTAGRPSIPGGSVTPSPVVHRVTTVPGFAGDPREFDDWSSFVTAPWPRPEKSA